MRNLFLAFLALAVIGLVSVALAENEATFDPTTGTLHIPKVIVGSAEYQVDMQQMSGLNFTVVNICGGDNSSCDVKQISNIDEFLEKCPTDDPAFSTIMNDFKIRRNGILVNNFQCNTPISKLPIAQYTDELIVLQGLRTMYYMDRNQTNHLPWTSGNLYDWVKSKIAGINISDTATYSYCCTTFDNELYIVVTAEDDASRDFDRTWRGISGNIALYAHEVRHVDGYSHVSCCGITGGCDQEYDEDNLSCYGIQWWLNKAWLSGKINVGIGCLDSNRIEEISNWHLDGCNVQFRNRFCENPPPELTMPSNPGGTCTTN